LHRAVAESCSCSATYRFLGNRRGGSTSFACNARDKPHRQTKNRAAPHFPREARSPRQAAARGQAPARA
jgi:hypothetical protein